MSRRLLSITLDNLNELPRRCRACVFWELDPAVGQGMTADAGLDKEAWVSATLLQWGSCGKLVQVDEVTAGYVLYAPPSYVPRSTLFPSSPVSADAVLLMTGRVLPEFAGAGLGRMLIQGLARDLVRREVRAIEAFGDAKPDGLACVVPAEYLRAVGFKTVRHHKRYPRLRLDLELKNTAGWRSEMEAALERILDVSIPAPALRLG
ncbi:MAG: GNAT family N-acetyltransferase [Sporichthyaceae bacterium]